MAFYEPLPDGSNIVRTDDGRELRTALPAEQLAASGFQLAVRDFDQLDDRTMPQPQPMPAPEPQPADPMAELVKRLDETRSQYDPEYAARRQQRKQEEADRAENERTQQVLETARRNADAARAAEQSQWISGDEAAGLDPNTQFVGVPSGGLRLPAGFEPYQKPKPPQLQRVAPPSITDVQQPTERPVNEAAQRVYDIAMANALRRTPASRGGMMPASTTKARSEVVSPEDLQAVDDAEREAEGVKLANAQAAQIDLERNIIAPQAAALQRDVDNLSAQYERRKQYDAKLAQLETYARKQEDKAAELKNLTPSDELFKGGGGFVARILSAIGQAMGAYASTMTGSPNFAHEIAQGAVREMAEKQRRDFEQAQAAGRTARNAYSEALAQYGNPEMAQQALHDRGEAIYRKMLELSAIKHGSPDMVARVKAENADAETQRRMRWAERNGKAAGSVSESFRYVPPSGGGVNIDAKMLGLAADVAKSLGSKPEDQEKLLARAVRLPTGEYAYATSANTASKVQEQLKVDNRIAEQAARLIHLRQQPGAKTDPATRAKIKGAAADLFLALKSGANLGTLDKGSLDFRDEWLGKPTDLIDFGGADALLQEVAGAAKQRVEDSIRYDLHRSPTGLAPVRGNQPSGVKSDE